MDSVIVGFVRQDTPTTTDYVFQILETVDEFKQEISDNSYKKIVDLLKKIHYLKTLPRHFHDTSINKFFIAHMPNSLAASPSPNSDVGDM